MGILDIFSGKKQAKSNEANTLFGQTQLGNNILVASGKPNSGQQMLYVTTSSATTAGRVVDMSVLSRNSTVMACVGAKARALSQLPIRVMYKGDDGEYVNALESDDVGNRDKAKAKQILNLLQTPNNFQTQYEFWYQTCMWLDLAGETFTLWWRKDRADSLATPLEMYNLDATLITVQLSQTRYPAYRLSTSTYGFSKEEPLGAHEVMHITEAAWQGVAGFNKGILATELVALDTDIDLYANHVMQNGAKPSGIFMTDQVVPAAKYQEIAGRLKEAWANITGSRDSDASKPGQGMLLDQGMKYTPVGMLTLQDADAAKLKEQTMKRICGLFGVPPAMVGISGDKFNNTQTILDEFYKSTMCPMITLLEQKLKQHLCKGYPNLMIQFDIKDFLKGAPLDQMNFAVAGVNAGIFTVNEAREYLNIAAIEGADELKDNKPAQDEPAISGQSPQSTGGGGGNQKRKMNIGAT